jgi:hypothetical protein
MTMHVVGMMREGPVSALTCRTVVVQMGKVACGLVLAMALLGVGWVHPTAAQDYDDTGQDSTQVYDDTGQDLGIASEDAQEFAESCGASADDPDAITLSAGEGGATLTVSPGHASAVSAVAEAHAGPGCAETIGAAARAVADCEDGALTEGAAALAVAHPDEGAATESAVTEISAKNNKDDKPIRKSIENRCHKEEKKIEKAPPPEEEEVPVPEVVEVPVTGAGLAGNGVAALFGVASVAAASGAFALRRRGAIELPVQI